MAIIGINYEESKPETYKSVYIKYGKDRDKEKIFDSGDFIRDWYSCNKFIINEDLVDTEIHFSNSSSVDHFLMDGAPFKSMFLYMKEEVPYLSEEFNPLDPGIEFFVKEKESPTWEELKEYCKEDQ